MSDDSAPFGTRMRRILILGPAGSGKSTLARRLGDVLGHPVVHLDAEFWSPGWEMPSREEWIDRQEVLVERSETWIMDGNYDSTLEVRLRAADTVLLLDVPRLVSLYRVLKRWIVYAGRTRPDMADGCPEKVDREFLRYVWHFHAEELPLIERKLARFDGLAVVRLDSSAEIDRFVERLG